MSHLHSTGLQRSADMKRTKRVLVQRGMEKWRSPLASGDWAAAKLELIPRKKKHVGWSVLTHRDFSLMWIASRCRLFRMFEDVIGLSPGTGTRFRLGL